MLHRETPSNAGIQSPILILRNSHEIVSEAFAEALAESVASEQSYRITLSNNQTEKAAIDYLLSVDTRFWVPTSTARKQILKSVGVSTRLARAFDLVLDEHEMVSESGLRISDIENVTLVELKTTRKRLSQLPKGFFFGATQNEFDLAAALGDRFRFCFVCLHPETPGHSLLTLDELETLVRSKRTQYQINL